MLSFHNDPKIKRKYIARVKAHRKADKLIQGVTYKNGRGCAVGCTLLAYDHKRYPIELGLPTWLAYLEDAIFENLPAEYAKLWPEAFLRAIPIGITEEQFIQLNHGLSIIRQERNLKLQEEQYSKTPFIWLKDVINSIKVVILYHKHPVKLKTEPAERILAMSVGRSADLAAWSAADSAAWLVADSAAMSADSAVWSVLSTCKGEPSDSAAKSADLAAEAAAGLTESRSWSEAAKIAAWSAVFEAYILEAKTLISLLKKLKRD